MLQDRRFFQIGVNNYVPAMQYAASGGHTLGPERHGLGTPAAAGAISSGINVAAGAVINTVAYLTTPLILDATYGRTITVTPSGVPGGTGVTPQVVGYDYMGQPMVESFVIGAAVGTAIVGLKAWKCIIGTRVAALATNAITISISTGASLGLPWKGTIVAAKEGATNITYAAINTNFVAAVLTDPATAVTGDPRGLYTPTSAPNGVLTYEVAMIGDTSVNALNNGGLLGIRQLAF